MTIFDNGREIINAMRRRILKRVFMSADRDRFERGRNRLQEFVHGFIAVFLLPAMLIKQVFPNQKNADAHLIRRRYLLVLGIRLQIINQLSHLLLAEGTKALRAHALFQAVNNQKHVIINTRVIRHRLRVVGDESIRIGTHLPANLMCLHNPTQGIN